MQATFFVRIIKKLSLSMRLMITYSLIPLKISLCLRIKFRGSSFLSARDCSFFLVKNIDMGIYSLNSFATTRGNGNFLITISLKEGFRLMRKFLKDRKASLVPHKWKRSDMVLSGKVLQLRKVMRFLLWGWHVCSWWQGGLLDSTTRSLIFGSMKLNWTRH